MTRQPSLKYASSPRHKTIGPEARLHLCVVQHLMLRGVAGMMFLHPANEGRRSERSGAFLKRMGMRPGAADLLIFHQGRAYALELKAKGGKASDEQVAFAADCLLAGVDFAVADCIADALSLLERWGLVKPDVLNRKDAA